VLEQIAKLASLLKMQELNVEVLVQFPPRICPEPHLEQGSMAIQVGVNEEGDHRFSPLGPQAAMP